MVSHSRQGSFLLRGDVKAVHVTVGVESFHRRRSKHFLLVETRVIQLKIFTRISVDEDETLAKQAFSEEK